MIRILHVDDEPDFAETAATFLNRQSDRIAVQTATSADEALTRLHEEIFDCVVSDYEMPGRDGIEFLKAVRERYPELPFILYTGKGSEEVASEAISAGVTEYIQKEHGTSQYEVLANRIVNAVEKHQAEHQLQDREEQLSLFFEQSPLGVIRWDEEFNFARLNETARAILGYSEGELVGQPWDTVVPDDIHDEIGQVVVSDLLKNEGGFHSINENVRKDGERITCEWHSWVVTDEHDEVVAVYSQFQDITQRTERERTLSQIVERTGDLLNASTKSDIGQVAIDIVGRVLNSPLAGVHLVSADGDQLESVAALDNVRDELGVPPTYDREADDAAADTVWAAFSAGDSQYIDDTRNHGNLAEETPARSGVIHPLGEHGVLIVSSTELDGFDETDRNHIELLGRTLTAALDRVERESDLRRRTQQLERLHRAGQDLIQADTPEEIATLIAESTADILDHSITMVRYYDESEGGLVPIASTDATVDVFESRPVFGPDGGSLNWSAYESQTPAVYDDIKDIDQAVDSDTAIRSLMLLPLGEHGTISIGDTIPDAFDDSDVFQAQLLATTAELALSRLTQQNELVRQRDQLDRQNERLEEFAGVVSHDLRNPLNIVGGRLEFAKEECDSDHLEKATDALDRSIALIDDLLTLAREGEQVGSVESVDLADTIDGCWRNVETADATLVTELDRTIHADPNRLKQLLENLMRNAVEHGGPDVTVTIGALAEGFYVADDGPGIPPDERTEVFDAGYSTAENGTGFGLNIVKQIADAHGWTLQVSEAAGGGARFEITGVQTE